MQRPLSLMQAFWDKRNLSIKYRPITLESYGDAEFLTYEDGMFWDGPQMRWIV